MFVFCHVFWYWLWFMRLHVDHGCNYWLLVCVPVEPWTLWPSSCLWTPYMPRLFQNLDLSFSYLPKFDVKTESAWHPLPCSFIVKSSGSCRGSSGGAIVMSWATGSDIFFGYCVVISSSSFFVCVLSCSFEVTFKGYAVLFSLFSHFLCWSYSGCVNMPPSCS